MAKTAPFERYTDRYDAWFDEHDALYRAELDALGRFLPSGGTSLEVGVGTGRFADPLSIDVGVDPAVGMLEHARERGVGVVRGVAEHLPFADGSVDVALVVTTVCFVDDVSEMLGEVHRVLAPSGVLVTGYVDADSRLGRRYRKRREENPFYRDAEFTTTDEYVDRLDAAGFEDFEFVQTVFDGGEGEGKDENENDNKGGNTPTRVEDGYGDGSFVAVGATRSSKPD